MKDLVNRKELAEHFGVYPSTINRWREKGCPNVKLATGRIMYRIEEVEKWLLGGK